MSESDFSQKELVNIGFGVRDQWTAIIKHPARLADLADESVFFAAGGALPIYFGDESFKPWERLVEVANSEGKIELAGIEFSLEELETMGDFYRFLKEQGFDFLCIDERLKMVDGRLEGEVHVQCGACAEVGKAIGLPKVEDMLLQAVGYGKKEKIYPDMPEHESMVILVDFVRASVALGDLREELKQNQALSFNASIPLEYLCVWEKDGRGNAWGLMQTLIKWNVLLARKIIGGDHNRLRDLADLTMLVADIRGAEGNRLLGGAIDYMRQVVPHEIYDEISHY